MGVTRGAGGSNHVLDILLLGFSKCIKDGMVWYGIRWHGMVWLQLAWHSTVWYAVAWYGMTSGPNYVANLHPS